MNIKNEIINIKNELTKLKMSRQERIIGHQPTSEPQVFRLRYVEYYELGEMYKAKGRIDCCFDQFLLPKNMTLEEAFKVLSFLKDYLEENANLEPNSYYLVTLLNDSLNLERLGFQKLPTNSYCDSPIDLFIILGRNNLLFTKYYSKYFKWYIPNISEPEIAFIYDRIGLKFISPKFSTEKDSDNPSLVRKISKELETFSSK